MSDSENTGVILEGDDLDRGEYAMTLFKIISDYSPKVPKKGYEVLYDTFDLGEIYRGEINIPKMSKEEMEKMLASEEAPNATDAANNPPQSEDPDFTGKYHHLDNAAFVMAISGSWGTGKTTFVKLLSNLLRDTDKIREKGKDAEFIESHRFKKDEVVIFDAWKNDFYNDPLIPFSRMLIDAICDNETDKVKAANHMVSYMKSLKKTSYGIAVDTLTDLLSHSPLVHINDQNGTALAGLFTSNTLEKEQPTLNDIFPVERGIFEIQDILQKAIRKKEQHKFVVIIDELDRCKPTFAIQLLEIVKHLFNIKGLVFIFSLDIDELKHCVKRVYGNDFDAIGYLERFFDYNTILPKGDDKKLFDKFAEEYGISKEDRDQYYKMCNQFELTPREMKGLCSSFYFLNTYQLKEYPAKAKLLYFYILLLKYKNPDKIQKLKAGRDDTRNALFGTEQPRPEFLLSGEGDYHPFYEAVLANKTIEETSFSYIDVNGQYSHDSITLNESSKPFNDNDDRSLSNILYPNDLDKGIFRILHLHILEFLFNKVETISVEIPVAKKEEEVKRGTILSFGKYYKYNDKEKEPIEWIVLDVKDNKALLISRYGIEVMPYHATRHDIRWDGCTLRTWLNGKFMEEAFDDDDVRRIDTVYHAGETNIWKGIPAGKGVWDKVFLLSIEEAERLFETGERRKCIPTEYAKWRGVYFNEKHNSSSWWLRSPGSLGGYAAGVSHDGSVLAYGFNVYHGNVAVRLALWLILNP